MPMVRGQRKKQPDEYGPPIYEVCGTTKGWNFHRRDKTPVCLGCQDAFNEYMYEYRHRVGLTKSRTIMIPDDGLRDGELLRGALEYERTVANSVDPFDAVQRIIDAIYPFNVPSEDEKERNLSNGG